MNKPVQRRERPDITTILGMDAISASFWQRPWLKWAVTALIVVFAAGAIRWFAGGTSTVHYVTEPARRGNLVVIVTATGSVQPTKKVDVSSELSGTIRKVLVDYNSVVTAGQPLAQLDTDKLEASVKSSRAKLAAAKAKVTDAEATIVEKDRDLARKKTLVTTHNISTQELDAAQAAYDRAIAALASAHADVGVAEADLQLNETNLSKACICSPISGVVLTRNVDPGQTVASTLQAPILFSIAEDLKQMEVQVDVDEADVGKVKTGQTATFSVDAFPDRRFPAKIRDIRFASEIIQGVVTYKAVLDIDNSEMLLRPGMTATAEIKVIEITDALLVPNAAVRYTPTAAETTGRGFLSQLLSRRPPFRPASQQEETGRNRTVWMLGNGEPAQVRIEAGSSDGRHTEVQGGDLKAGQALIVGQTSTKQ